MYIERYKKIEKLLEKGKVLMIYGPRQAGKTSLVKDFLSKTKLRYVFESGEFLETKLALGGEPKKTTLLKYGQFNLLVLDEAQLVPNIGRNLKALIDTFPNIYIIATGSSSFDLSGQVGEPLVGRQRVLHLFPFWEQELKDANIFEPSLYWYYSLVFGRYPEIVVAKTLEQKKIALQNIINGYLFKDILAFERLKKPEVVVKLLGLLAHQIGNEVSVSELAASLSVNQRTVAKYLNLLEQSFVIFHLSAFSGNPRKEIQQKKKYYFYDLGIRNGIISNFENLDNRNDVGFLWENFCIVERMKLLEYTNSWKKSFFWRRLSGGEVDYVEVEADKKFGYEFKWNEKKDFKKPASFLAEYPKATWEVVNPGNYENFILLKK